MNNLKGTFKILAPAVILLLVSLAGFGASFGVTVGKPAQASTVTNTIWLPVSYSGVTVTASYKYAIGNNGSWDYRRSVPGSLVRNIPTAVNEWVVLTCVGGDFVGTFYDEYKSIVSMPEVQWVNQVNASVEMISRADNPANVCASGSALVKERWQGATRETVGRSVTEYRTEKSDGYLFARENIDDGYNTTRLVSNNVINPNGWEHFLVDSFRVDPQTELPNEVGTGIVDYSDNGLSFGGINTQHRANYIHKKLMGIDPTIANGTLDWARPFDVDRNQGNDGSESGTIFVLKSGETVQVHHVFRDSNFYWYPPTTIYVRNTGWRITVDVNPI